MVDIGPISVFGLDGTNSRISFRSVGAEGFNLYLYQSPTLVVKLVKVNNSYRILVSVHPHTDILTLYLYLDLNTKGLHNKMHFNSTASSNSLGIIETKLGVNFSAFLPSKSQLELPCVLRPI